MPIRSTAIIGERTDRVRVVGGRPIRSLSARASAALRARVMAREEIAAEILVGHHPSIDRGLARRTPRGHPLLGTAGTSRNSWRVSLGSRIDTSTATPRVQRLSLPKVPSLTRPQAITVSNAAWGARATERALYPKRPRRGTYIPGHGFQIRSANGRSKQAQQGIVGPVIASMRSKREQVARLVERRAAEKLKGAA